MCFVFAVIVLIIVYGLFWVFRGGLRKVYLSLMVCFIGFWFMRVDDSYSYLSLSLKSL